MTGPQYYEFKITDEIKNSNIILVFLYLVMFLILSIKLRRDEKQHRSDVQNIEMKPLREMDEHQVDSI